MIGVYRCIYRGFSRDVTLSRVCLVTPLIRHFGGQSFGGVCAVCALQCVVNPIGPRILLKYAFLFPGFLANFERFYLFVLKN